MTVGKFLEKIWCFQKDFLSQGSKALRIQRHKKMQRWCCSIWSEKHTSDQYHWGRERQKRARVCCVPAQLCARPVLASHHYHPTWGAQPNRAGPTVTSVSQKRKLSLERLSKLHKTGFLSLHTFDALGRDFLSLLDMWGGAILSTAGCITASLVSTH